MVAPSGPLDVVWHALLMFPKDYCELCLALCGKILDHNPLVSRATGYQHTLVLYRATFLAEPPALFWEAATVDGASQAELSSKRMAQEETPAVADANGDSGRAKRSKVAAATSGSRIAIDDLSRKDGATFFVDVTEVDEITVGKLKQRISAQLNFLMPVHDQRLLLCGVELDDDHRLSPAGRVDLKIQLTRKMLGC